MTWETDLFDLFDDLEQQAAGLARAALDEEVAELGRAEYAEVDLAARLHGSLGATVAMSTAHVSLYGRLARVGRDWCLLEPKEAPAREWVLNVRHVLGVRGLTDRAVPEPARSVVARLTLASALRRLGDSRDAVLVVRADGTRSRGRLGRVGADFVELLVAEPGPYDAVGPVEVLPLSGLVAVQRL